MDENKDIPLPSRMNALESAMQSIMGTLDTMKTFLSGVPVLGTVIVDADAAAHIVNAVVNIAEGKETTDTAALAAGAIAISTGNPGLDSRLMEIESFISAAGPLLAIVAHHFGLDAPAPVTVAAPMSLF
jgi:hypothetical protein